MPHPHLPIQMSTEHFRLETDISKDFLQHMAPFLEAAHKQISVLPGFEPKSPRHQIVGIWVFFCRDQESFTGYTKSEGSFAIPSRASGRAYVRCVPESLYETRRRVLHELCHIYLWAAGLSIGRADRSHYALEERMCDVVSWHHWDGKQLILCHAPNAPLFQIKELTGKPAERLATGEMGVMEPFQGAQRSTGEVYAILHFLLTRPEGREFLKLYGAYRRAGKDVADAATAASSRTVSALESAGSAHGRFLYTLSLNVVKDPVHDVAYDQYTEDARLQQTRLKEWQMEGENGP